MTDPLPKHLTDREQWSPDDFFNFAKTGDLPVNPEWVERRSEALADAGLEVDQIDGVAPTDIEEMSPGDHAARKYGRR